jgi:hypothetical protein
MSTKIKCPNCNHEFPLEAALNDEMKSVIEKEKEALRRQAAEFKQKKETELAVFKKTAEQEAQKKEAEWQQKLTAEKLQIQQQLETQIRKNISEDFENRLQLLQKTNEDHEEKLKLSRQKELDFLKREAEFKMRENELELTVQKKLSAEREKISEEFRKIETEKSARKETEYQLKLKELEKQLDDQKKLAEEMRRKSEQGSTQLQGEVQELILEELLQTTFPFDKIEEVAKGVRGADCTQIVHDQFGNQAGRIIYESKRTKDFSHEWIEKLKKDMRNLGADVAVIVTQVLPKDMSMFGEKEGVYICTFSEVKSVALLLRNAILKLYGVTKSQENKGDKMVMLYDYLTSAEFAEQWKAIREGFLSMKISIQKERDAMERLWKAREKQLEKVLLNATHIHGSIDGISGLESVDLNLLGYEEDQD